MNEALVADLHHALDEAEANPSCRIFVLRGQQGIFCTGMDLSEAPGSANASPPSEHSPYMELLKRFASSALFVVAAVDGKVLAGGLGLAIASDMFLATAPTTMALSEALFGLIPAQLMPFLIRRAGFQAAYRMTLTTTPIGAAEAQQRGIVDEVCEDLDKRLRELERRVAHIPRHTVSDVKAYFRKLWLIDEKMEKSAVDEFNRLVETPHFKTKVAEFLASKTSDSD